MHMQTCQIKQNVIFLRQILNPRTLFFLGRREYAKFLINTKETILVTPLNTAASKSQ
jgi:hypothetical protein